MTANDILDALGDVKEQYILEALPQKKKSKYPHIRKIAAALAIAALLAFSQTAPGNAAFEGVKEVVISFIEILFPPKNIPVTVEGETQYILQQAGGQEPEIQEGDKISAPGFAIYFDPERYTMTEENGLTYIRYNIENDLPPCEVEIRHISDSLPSDAASATRASLSDDWETISEIIELEDMSGVYFHVSSGSSWDAPCEDVYFLNDGQGGSFCITARYFMEATEGHGVRFAQMIRTFEVISSTELENPLP